MKIIINENQFNTLLLIEASATEIRQKYYPNISDDDFNKIVSADNVSSNLERNKLGEYGKWLLNLYKKNQLKIEDLYKAKEYIPIFDKAKKSNKLEQPDINKYKSLSELFTIVEPFINKSSFSNESGDITESEYDNVYEDDEWIVLIPKTKNAACVLGSGTEWCTANREHNAWDSYKNGKLYININKKTGDKYQFHFESGQFMDKYDNPQDIKKLHFNDNITNFYKKNVESFMLYYSYDYVDVSKNTPEFYIVQLNYKYGVVNVKNDILIPVKFEFIKQPKQNQHYGWFIATTELSDCIVDINQHFIKPPGKYDFISCHNNNGIFSVRKNRKLGFLNKNGEQITPIKYDEQSIFQNGFNVVVLNKKQGVINIDGKEIVPPIYDFVSIFVNGYAKIGLNNKLGIINTNGEIVVPIIYDKIGEKHANNCVVGHVGEKSYIIDLNNITEKPKLFRYPKPRMNINEMPYPESFNMDNFKSINSFINRVQYCKLHLSKIAEGSSRIAFAIDDTKVLKLAKNRKGLAQNENEADMGYNENYFDSIAKVIDYDESYTFIEMERAWKCSPQEFKNIVGYSLEDVVKYIENDLAGDNQYPDCRKQNIPKEILEDMYENEFIVDLNDFMHNYRMLLGDIGKINSYGIVLRNGHKEVVLLDYGVTQETWNKHYVKRRY